MAVDRRKTTLTDEQIEEAVRARKARTRYGIVFVAIGSVGFLVTLAVSLVRDGGVPGGLAIMTMCFAMSSVGAGFADPSELRGFWK